MGTYMALVDVRECAPNNAQELATAWGELNHEIEELDADLLDAWAVLGERDFMVLFEADDREHALKISLLVERRGLDMQTMELIPVERFGAIVDDI